MKNFTFSQISDGNKAMIFVIDCIIVQSFSHKDRYQIRFHLCCRNFGLVADALFNSALEMTYIDLLKFGLLHMLMAHEK